MILRLLVMAFGALCLGGCIPALVGLGVQAGAHVVGAGIKAASGQSEPDVEAFCWDPEKQSASTSTSPSCWSPQVNITENEYDNFRETGVAPSVPKNQVAITSAASKEVYCLDPTSQHFYILRYVEHCPTGDVMLPKAEWQKRQGVDTETAQVAVGPTPVYCWDSKKALEYQLADGESCGTDSRITEEQYKTQHARREETKRAKAQAEQQAKIEPPKPMSPEPPTPDGPTSQDQAAQTQVQQPSASAPQQAMVTPTEINLDAYNIASFGTGFFVSPKGHLLTNHHVVAKCDAVAALAGGIFEADVLDSNERFDLAVLKLPFPVESYAAFASATPEQGDDVYAVGYPLVDDFKEIKITNGIVSGLSGPDRDKSRIQMTAAVQPGNSGGPLVNTSGQIVGVVVSKYSGDLGGGYYAEGINFAVAHEAAAAFLSLNGITAKRASSAKELKGREIMRRAKAWTVPLLCLSKKPAG